VRTPEVARYRLASGLCISRVIKGGWQLAGGHGRVEGERALEDMRLYVEAGITTFDCADIYTGVEGLIGQFLQRHRDELRSGALPPIQVHTKYVPDLDSLATLRRVDVESAIDRSLHRLGVEQLDLVQLHWWDFDIPGYVEAATHLHRLQSRGKIRYIGVTNFDAAHLTEILDAGVPVVSNQVQHSLLDHRPQGAMTDLCQRYGISLLCYGTVAGGFLSDRYLGWPEPKPPYENRSLAKYKLIIDEFGGWTLYQELLRRVKAVAIKHQASIATVSMHYALKQRKVGAIVVGARHARHLADTLRLFSLDLDAEDLDAIREVTARSSGPCGDVYALERVKGGKHAAIMKYNLNQSSECAEAEALDISELKLPSRAAH
jgi:aryl-alcohol dehydrogenase-like predicted oxidoreductase